MTYFLEKATNYCAEHFHYFFFSSLLYLRRNTSLKMITVIVTQR